MHLWCGFLLGFIFGKARPADAITSHTNQTELTQHLHQHEHRRKTTESKTKAQIQMTNIHSWVAMIRLHTDTTTTCHHKATTSSMLQPHNDHKEKTAQLIKLKQTTKHGQTPYMVMGQKRVPQKNIGKRNYEHQLQSLGIFFLT